MKTANFTFIFLLFGWSTIFAQIQKGNTYLAPLQLKGGAFGLADDKLTANVQMNTETKGNNTYNFAILPTYGAALTDNLLLWVVGL